MVKTKNLVFGILWTLLFELLFGIALAALLTLFLSFKNFETATINKMVAEHISNYGNLLSIVPFYFSMYLTINRRLPGTRTPNWETVEEVTEQFDIKIALGLIIQFFIIQAFTLIVFNGILEALNLKTYSENVYIKLSSYTAIDLIALVYFSRMFKINLLKDSTKKIRIFPVALAIPLLFISEILISSELGKIGLKYIPFKTIDPSYMYKLMNGGISSILVIAVIAPLFEEFFFRRLLLKNMLRNYSPHIAILLSSILFSCVHLNTQGFLAILFIGIILGSVYYATNDLRYSIILHCMHNIVVYFMYTRDLKIPIAGFTTTPLEPSQVQFHPLWLDLSAVIALSVITFGLLRNRRKRENRNAQV